ncbi:glycosyltransferase family 39 protein [Draconibacterium sp.]|nr:glycosyltransferase family 39 protein [Draconibacterium sp.]
MFENKTLRTIFFIIVITAIGSYLAGLSIDVTRDAGKYATVSKEIFQNNNYINLTIHGNAYDQKPPMLFWLGALGFSIGTLSNFWFKFPVLILVFLGFYWAFQLGKSLYNKRVGFLTATLLAFSFIYSLYSSDIHTDTPLQVFVTLALWQLSEFIKTRKTIHWIFGFIGIGLAMLTKGPIGGAIPAFAVIGHILLKKDFKFLYDYRWFAGIALALLVASPALIGLMNQFGWKGIWFFFWENNVGRITGSYVQAINDPFFYVHNLLYLFLPWSLLFYISAFFEFKMLIKNRFRSTEYFTLTGIWIYFIVINAASSQLPNYIFIIIPLIAVLTAKWIDIALDEKEKILRIFNRTQNVVVLVIWVLILAIIFYLFPPPQWYFWIIISVGLLLTFFVFAKTKNAFAKLILPSVIAITCLTFLLNTHVLPYIFSFQAPPKAARYFTNNAEPGDKLYNYKYDQYELFFYSEPQASQINKNDKLEEIIKTGTWIFTNPNGLDTLNMMNIKPDTVIEYQHLYLNRPGNFLNPGTREETLQPMYLIKY